MKQEEKNQIIDRIAEEIKSFPHFYLTDISDYSAKETSDLRRKCFEKNIRLMVVKNTLFRKALEKSNVDFSELFPALKGSTSVMFTEQGTLPSKLIKELRKKSKKPILKAAYIDECFYFGDNQLDVINNLKSKNELLGDIIYLLQSPMKKVVSQLQSGGYILAGVVKTLSEKES